MPKLMRVEYSTCGLLGARSHGGDIVGFVAAEI
jgi:hypothetical protein